MSSGLYAFPGASATATAAAWANRLDEPMTNVSKTYFGFRRVSRWLPGAVLPPADPSAPGAVRPANGGSSAEVEATEGFVDMSPCRSVDSPPAAVGSAGPAPGGVASRAPPYSV